MNEHAVRRIANYLAGTSTYVYLPDGNRRLTTCGVVYRPDIENGIKYFVDANFSGICAQADSDHAENSMFHTGYVIRYAECPVLWCSRLQT